MNYDSSNRKTEPVPIGLSAVENIRYIRSTIEAASTFTTIPGKGCILMGAIALLAAAAELVPAYAQYWLPIWLVAAVAASAVGLYFMSDKARKKSVALSGAVAVRFFLTLGPGFIAGALLTVALIDTVPRITIAGVWLLTYGIGIAACGVFSISLVLIAGFAFMGLGAVALLAPSVPATILLALGFGGVHVVLGTLVVRDYGG
jgi:hypothetical protein